MLSLRAQSCEQDLGGSWNQNLGQCENISLGSEGSGSFCGTCQFTESFESPTNHRDLHQSTTPGGKNKINKKWSHHNKVSGADPNGGDQNKSLGVNCVTKIQCQGNNICSTADDGSWCVPSCPEGYSLRDLYEDFEVTDETYTSSVGTIIRLKSCIKD